MRRQMAVTWTQEQEKVIETRGRNILVSAAAGSGKTAVLVARILGRICDEKDPVGIDELLIVTFTKAAAGELRERIGRALEEARERDPENAHLSRQSVLMSAAQITTIDGFCSFVVRSYGHLVDVPPVFRVAESGEAELLKQDALKEILEEAYADDDPAFREALESFVETFASGKSEDPMEKIILRIAYAAEGSPDPDAFLLQCREETLLSEEGEIFETRWFREDFKRGAASARQGLGFARNNLEMASLPEGPSAYLSAATADAAFFEELLEAFSACEAEEVSGDKEAVRKGYDRVRKILTSFQSVRLSAKRPSPGEDPALRETFKACRSKLKDVRDELLNEYFPTDSETAAEFCKKSAGPLRTLLELVQRFRERYAVKKRERNLLDFSDLEHFALRILKKDGGRSYAAKELSARFKEVMIDEYQDSNYLQEEILLSVSRLVEGEQNYFCVGDVKQSIYSFRQARPDLFMEKFERFHRDEKEGVRIDLHRNFRSTQSVIDSVNGLFEQIMVRECGGVDYDEDAALICGAAYPALEGRESELLVLLKEGETGRLSSAEIREMEARMVGMRIQELMEGGQLWDAREERVRKPRFGDIVILLRTMEGWADVFVRVLESMRIPAYATSTSGYFSAMEVTAVLNYLSVLDNPQQDIPFAAVLTSAFVSLSAEQLARIRTADLASSLSGSTSRDDVSVYAAARAYAENTGDDSLDRALQNTLQDFFALFDSFKEKLHDTPLHELISQILSKTGFLDYASALPGGAQRLVNLRMLIDKAAEYEETSYVGLFHFMRYIENLKTYSQDFGELAAISEHEDVVRIYSIHKSKGLEYPVVFVSGLSKNFNLQDINAEVLIHPQMGIASNYFDYVKRTKAPTLHYQAIRRQLLAESIGEELRVLYVALTRAQQKLILTGTFANAKKLEELFLMIPDADRTLPVAYIEKCRDCLHWILPSAKRMNERMERIGLPPLLATRLVSPEDLAEEELLTSIRREEVLEELAALDQSVLYDAATRRAIKERFSFRYPHAQVQLPVELSVSELKEAAIRGMYSPLAGAEESGEEQRPFSLFEEEVISPLVPEFYRKEHEADAAGEEGTERIAQGGAARGTAYHHLMEMLQMKAFSGLHGSAIESTLEDQVQELIQSGRLTEEERKLVKLKDVAIFLESSLGQQMAAADVRGDLYREQPFVLRVDASALRSEWPEGESVFVQGIIDAFFYESAGEEAGIVLMDYKTDRVKTGEELIARYLVQLETYAGALSRVSGRKVLRTSIWSFALGREIPLGGF